MKDPSTGNPPSLSSRWGPAPHTPFWQVAVPLKDEDDVFVGIMRLKMRLFPGAAIQGGSDSAISAISCPARQTLRL